MRQTAKKPGIFSTENFRKRIWGTEEPPGLEDPYGGPSIVEERNAAKQRKAAKQPKEPASKAATTSEQPAQAPQPVDDPNYQPAITWEGLAEVGEPPVTEFEFEGFMPPVMVANQYEATAAVHRAIVEVFSLKQMGRPLSDLSQAGRGIDVTNDVQISGPHSKASGPTLTFPDGMSAESIVESTITQEADAVIAEEAFVESHITDYEGQVASWQPTWLQVSLENPEVKFAVRSLASSHCLWNTHCYRLSSELCNSLAFAFLTATSSPQTQSDNLSTILPRPRNPPNLLRHWP